MAAVLWIIGFVLCLILEAATSAFVSIWFAVGAVGGFAASLCGASVWVQLFVFVAVSALFLGFTRPLVRKLLPRKFTPTNSELSLGRTAEVIEDIDNVTGQGRIRLDGVDWSASSEDGTVIKKGESVTVTKLGITSLTVKSKSPELLAK